MGSPCNARPVDRRGGDARRPAFSTVSLIESPLPAAEIDRVIVTFLIKARRSAARHRVRVRSGAPRWGTFLRVELQGPHRGRLTASVTISTLRGPGRLTAA